VIFDVCCVRQSPYNLGRLVQVGIFAKGKTKQAERRSRSYQVLCRFVKGICTDSALEHEKVPIANLLFCKWSTTEAGQASPHPYRELKPGPSDALLSARFGTCVAAFEIYSATVFLQGSLEVVTVLEKPMNHVFYQDGLPRQSLVSDNDTPKSDCSWRRHYLDCGIGCLPDD
jgi:hypothetical protein